MRFFDRLKTRLHHRKLASPLIDWHDHSFLRDRAMYVYTHGQYASYIPQVRQYLSDHLQESPLTKLLPEEIYILEVVINQAHHQYTPTVLSIGVYHHGSVKNEHNRLSTYQPQHWDESGYSYSGTFYFFFFHNGLFCHIDPSLSDDQISAAKPIMVYFPKKC